MQFLVSLAAFRAILKQVPTDTDTVDIQSLQNGIGTGIVQIGGNQLFVDGRGLGKAFRFPQTKIDRLTKMLSVLEDQPISVKVSDRYITILELTV